MSDAASALRLYIYTLYIKIQTLVYTVLVVFESLGGKNRIVKFLKILKIRNVSVFGCFRLALKRFTCFKKEDHLYTIKCVNNKMRN